MHRESKRPPFARWPSHSKSETLMVVKASKSCA
jgi:hypothetical protein